MVSVGPIVQELDRAQFGISVQCGDKGAEAAFDGLVAAADDIRARFNDAGGLLILRGLLDLERSPKQLVRLSRLFGPEVEDYRETLTAARFFHDEIPEILVLSNAPPCNHPPPPKPEPCRDKSGRLLTQFPHQKNWHTDQSYRRPPPDISLLYALRVPPPDQGQTLYADCTAAYAALDRELQFLIRTLNGIHSPSWIGRTPDDVRSGRTPKPLLSHQLPQRHPLVRFHPETGRPALYICEEKQMDFVDGPIDGLTPGPDGDGAALLRELLQHATRPEFSYVHEWLPGDLVIADNRCLLHAATWYDADRYTRLMWRTTVMGNPGAEYRGESKSWIPEEGTLPMQGMESA